MLRFVRRAGPVLLLLSSTPLAAQRSDRRVVDAAAIAAAGWHRLGDIVGALPPGSSASVDGFNHELAGSRLGFHETTGNRATWLVRLDGIAMPMRLGGLWILDALPVAITQLDSIVIHDGPRLTDGRAAMTGTIDLYTRRARRGPSLVADYQHGDESGDPGPYRYTPRATPNVEKLGPFASGAAAYATSRVAIDVAARYSSLNVTDQRIAAAVGPTFSLYQSDVNASGGSGVATIDALGGRHFIIGGRGRFTGLMDAPRTDGIQQGRVIAAHAGAAGSMRLAGRAWSYTASTTKLETARLGALPAPLPAQERSISEASLTMLAGARLLAGAGVSSGRLATGPTTSDETEGRAWASYATGSGSYDLAVAYAGGRPRISGAVRQQRALTDSTIFGLAVTALSAWRGNDYDWMDEGAGGDDGGMEALDVRGELTGRALLGLVPTWYLRATRYARVDTSGGRSFVGGGVAGATSPRSRVTARVRAELTRSVGDADPGERSTPTGFAEGSLSARTAGGFALAVSGRVAPATRWPARGLLPPEDVPSTRRIDVSVNKSLWSDRVRAQLVMRNLLNAAERTHPDGAQWNLRTHLAVTIALPSGATR